MAVAYIASLFLVVVAFFIVRLVTILPIFRTYEKQSHVRQTQALLNKYKNFGGQLHVFVFLGSGGHTGELLIILKNYKNILLSSGNTIHVGYSDVDSYNKFKELAKSYDCKVKYYRFVKAREVGASKLTSIKSILMTLIKSFGYVFEIRQAMKNTPHLVLFNGPGTCCILALWFKLLELIFPFSSSSNIVYIESLARINSLSLTGKVLYWIADEFIVQWEELKEKLGDRVKYFGILV
ncbi:hypothetical protein Kpol_1052p11 [Vanderwaltozyma polyspora DSM 70294]|uniref:UDP-N-acetylglucosamine transferase subunit ALG14 n=1 Tax=Vanderwaltozyma polyspora (strain ATCC 22028 / DSM 70294 / BCRC 21397 / CBS 2163 / NBRC 10782 / NRRL Y-8283 / UCD 57-17) TaxID=436907 RepID=A7TM22_VANPO|nr:uncharacterized protein Kpol_1052p11 [Vanderwaltozyma polyspora DSM 70294]EDO16664.1 hypothetical protein Kpol_1052p11 [Vanderwaltozyma polyspora DSM 70294]